MRFWDASAVVPLALNEESTDLVSTEFESDREMVVWWGTRIECLSGIRRRERLGQVSTEQIADALHRLEELDTNWIEVRPTEAIRAEAGRAIAVHGLTAADSLQLAAALTWRAAPDARVEFISLDRRLAESARLEGFNCPLQG